MLQNISHYDRNFQGIELIYIDGGLRKQTFVGGEN